MSQENGQKNLIYSLSDFSELTNIDFGSDNEFNFNGFSHEEIYDDIGFEFVFSDDKDEQYDTIDLPFWFGQEDHDHILQIIKIYDEALNLEKERKQCIRKPKPFIGSILRKPVKANTFKTFDKISVFQKAILPPGNEIPILKTVDALVHWDSENGLPNSIFIIQKKKEKKYWEKQAYFEETFSYLYCIPYDYDSEEWRCFPSKSKRSLKYVNDDNRFSFAPFIQGKIEEIQSCIKPRLGLSMSPDQ